MTPEDITHIVSHLGGRAARSARDVQCSSCAGTIPAGTDSIQVKQDRKIVQVHNECAKRESDAHHAALQRLYGFVVCRGC